jgi:hypothetical protein
MLTTWHPLPAKVVTNLADKQWLLGRFSTTESLHWGCIRGMAGQEVENVLLALRLILVVAKARCNEHGQELEKKEKKKTYGRHI